jgi:AraC family transcriptional regulator
MLILLQYFALLQYVKDSGWDKINEIHDEPWGARVCSVTTNDGYDLVFFELK